MSAGFSQISIVSGPDCAASPSTFVGGMVKTGYLYFQKPLVEQYLEYIHNNQLDKIDAIQYKSFHTSPSGTSGAFWHKDATYIDNLIASLGTTNDATDGPVKLMVTDYPNWHTTCSDNIEATEEWNGGESTWDSEYLAAMYISAYLGMAVFNQQNLESGGLANIALIEPHLAFLIDWGTDFYFHTNCEADGSSSAGFSGSLTLNSYLDIPKPIARVLNMLDALDGKLTLVASSDDNLRAYSGYKSQNGSQPESVTLVVSQFVPTEAQVNTFKHPEGLPSYEFGHLWTSNQFTNLLPQRRCPAVYACQDTLNICCTAQEFQDLVYDPDGYFPRDITRAFDCGQC